ncbi:MAG: hypothetical protein M3Y57_20290 [Acidobacteriota bacterium]|nr:hypothetical protein [Acidobacteriota bacterium]
MLRAFTSSLLSLLLLATVLWGGCISCEQYFMWSGAKSCCAADGHCRTKTPVKQGSDRQCKQIAFEHQKSVTLHAPPATPTSFIRFSPLSIEPLTRSSWANWAEPSPPDIQVLHSTFLI